MNILGISALYHDSAAALLRDGALVAAAHEERFTRKRHDAVLPVRAAAYCLEQAGLDIGAMVKFSFKKEKRKEAKTGKNKDSKIEETHLTLR